MVGVFWVGGGRNDDHPDGRERAVGLSRVGRGSCLAFQEPGCSRDPGSDEWRERARVHPEGSQLVPSADAPTASLRTSLSGSLADLPASQLVPARRPYSHSTQCSWKSEKGPELSVIPRHCICPSASLKDGDFVPTGKGRVLTLPRHTRWAKHDKRLQLRLGKAIS